MKQFISLTVFLFLFSMFAGISFANGPASTLPTFGNYVVSGQEDVELSVSSGVVTIAMPILSEQRALTADWQAFCSYAVVRGDKWVLVSQKDYSVPTIVTNGEVRGQFTLPIEEGWIWLRFWGQDKKTDKWLWINQTGRYTRMDDQGNPGYEMIVNAGTGEIVPVPSSYQIRD